MNFKQYYQCEATNYIDNVPYRDILDALHHIHLNYAKTGKTIVCTYTQINKVGVNPSTSYNTPTGIYFYTLKYLIRTGANPPFAGEHIHLNVCELTKPLARMVPSKTFPQKGTSASDYGSRAMNQALKQLSTKEEKDDFIASTLQGQKEWQKIKEITTDLYWRYDLPDIFQYERYMLNSDYSFIWIAMKELSNHDSFKWSQGLKALGHNGFIDEGTGTIHDNEPYQGLVFDKSSLKVIQTLDNSKNVSRYAERPDLYGEIDQNLHKLLPINDIIDNHINLNDKKVLNEWIASANQIIKNYLNFARFWIGKMYNSDNFSTRMKENVKSRMKSFIGSNYRKINNSMNEYKNLYVILLHFLQILSEFNLRDYKGYSRWEPPTQYKKLSVVIDKARNYVDDIAKSYNNDDDDTDFNVKYKKQSSKYPEKLR